MKNTKNKLSTLVGLLSTLILVPALARADTAKFDGAMQPVLGHYLAIHKALFEDKTEGVAKHAKALAAAVIKADPSSVTGEHAAHYKMLPMKAKMAAMKLAKAKTLEEMREDFKDLSRPLAMWGGMSKPKGVYVMFCSMAKSSWLQKGPEVKNPFLGSKMPGCGEVISGGEAKMKMHHGPAKMNKKMNHKNETMKGDDSKMKMN